jgi:hypothetical protein
MNEKKENWFFGDDSKKEVPFAVRYAELEQKQHALDITKGMFFFEVMSTFFILMVGILAIGYGIGALAKTQSQMEGISLIWPDIGLLFVNYLFSLIITTLGMFILVACGWKFNSISTFWKDFNADKKKIIEDRKALFGHDDFWTDSTVGKKIR